MQKILAFAQLYIRGEAVTEQRPSKNSKEEIGSRYCAKFICSINITIVDLLYGIY